MSAEAAAVVRSLFVLGTLKKRLVDPLKMLKTKQKKFCETLKETLKGLLRDSGFLGTLVKWRGHDTHQYVA